MNLEHFSNKLIASPADIEFSAVMSLIEQHFDYQPSGFDNAGLRSEAGQNEGSCKIFALAQHLKLSDQACLACFGDFYRIDVLQNPDGHDHGNIRQLLKTGLAQISFDHFPLRLKA
ncbi:HopJ type III effector protein [Simiduia curdlanivorans]|uniref:HopJ type III effector protein n=1 Tax=Simiduia curdlanivorans TaxID=1492769 RepID=A0ABV8V7J7_9GAMM|nr:HopJ type III effector protein [Simiduia curdlanivorans]MDN3638592.1 HopJ type III effector protein [Simiduia curdlanivorans]